MLIFSQFFPNLTSITSYSLSPLGVLTLQLSSYIAGFALRKEGKA